MKKNLLPTIRPEYDSFSVYVCPSCKGGLILGEQSLSCSTCQVAYAIISGIPNIHFSRSKVEKLPFPDDHFNAAFCGGALHLFPDTVAALREIGRTMKAGAPLVVMTFIVSNRDILRSRRIREHAQKDYRVNTLAPTLSATSCLIGEA